MNTEQATSYVSLTDEDSVPIRRMAPIPPSTIVSLGMSVLAVAVSAVFMSITLSELVTKPDNGVNCYDDLPCALTHTCSPNNCVGQQGSQGVRGTQGPQGPPGVCSCNGTGIITDASIAANANISRSKLAPGTPNWVVINDNTGFFSAERFLSTTRGGTGFDSSVSNGTVKVTNGVWSSSLVVNADISPVAGIARTKLATGTAQQVVINDASGILSSEAQLAPFRGGTGLDTTAMTGIVQITAGTWFVGAIDISSLSGVPNSVVVVNQFGQIANQSQLATTLGGTGFDSSTSTGVVKVSSGIWSTSQITNADINTTAAITRNKIACTTPFTILVNDQNGCMSEQVALNATLGGTGINSASTTGIAHVLAGVWSVSQIVNNDIASSAAINRGKIAATNANEVVINDNLGFLTTETFLNPIRGGTGVDSSESNGFAFVNGGAWSFVPGITNSSGLIMASGVFSPFLAYTGQELDVVDTKTNGSVCLIANGTGGAESICFVVGNTTVGRFRSSGLNLPTLNASSVVVTDANSILSTMGATSSNVPSTIVKRSLGGESDFTKVFTTDLTAVGTVIIEAASSAVLGVDGSSTVIGINYIAASSADTLVYRDDAGVSGFATINLTNLFTNQVVVTDSGQTLISMPYNETAVASTFMTRDASANTAVSHITVSATSNQIVFGTTNTVTLNSFAPSASRTINLIDPGGNANIITSLGTQTIGGLKTFQSLLTCSAGISTTLVTTSTGVQFPTTGGTPTTLNYHENGTHTTTWSGIWATAQNGNIAWERTGKTVTLLIPNVRATANTASNPQIDIALETRISPAQQQFVTVRIRDAAVDKIGVLQLNTDGTMFFGIDASVDAYTGSANSGWYAFSINYLTP